MLQQYVDMIFVGFHTSDIPMMLYTDIIDILFDIRPEGAIKEFLTIFGHKYDMCHKQVFVMPAMLISIIHKAPLYDHHKTCYHIYGESVPQMRGLFNG